MGKRRASILVAGSAAVIALFRILTWNYYAVGLRALRTEVRADGLLVGCLLALVLSYVPIRRWFESCCIWFLWPAVAVLVCDVIFIRGFIPLHESVAIAITLGATSVKPDNLFGRMLEWNYLKTTGVLSYSVYIWQQLFLRPNWGVFWPFLLGTSILFSYICIERPARRLGQRLASRRATSESMDAVPSAAV
jgi:peptidoglycan/LPS O-acetylase OafA/YrhL